MLIYVCNTCYVLAVQQPAFHALFFLSFIFFDLNCYQCYPTLISRANECPINVCVAVG